MGAEFSFLRGYSYAWKAGYKPKAFERLEKSLITQKQSPEFQEQELVLKDRKLADQIIDSYGKLGFLLLSKDYIQQTNGKNALSHIYVTYHLCNFIYDSKAFLDAVAVMLNDFCSVRKTRGDIDFKKSSFRNALTKKEPRLHRIIEKNKKWFETVASWRDALIHKYSTIIAPFVQVDSWPTEKELNKLAAGSPKCVMPMEPRPYLSPDHAELVRKYGAAVREIEPFCEEWIEKACNLYEQVCGVISQTLESQHTLDEPS